MTARPQRRRPRRSRAGTAAMEFAVCAPVMIGMFAIMVDVGNLLRARITVAGAVATSAQYALMTGSTVTAANLQAVVTGVTATAGLGSVSATVTGPACYCPTAYPVTFSSATCGSTCATNALSASTYVVIRGSYTYTPIAPHLSKIVTTTVNETTTVLLK